MVWKTLVAVAVSLSLTTAARADFIVYGTIGSTGNSFPFGGSVIGSATRYQQVYSSSFFSGPATIDTISFFNSRGIGSYRDGDYQFSLSTSAAPVNALNTVNFDANLGADQALFTSVSLSGAPGGGQIAFAGSPFSYDPSAGDLLLDIVITNPVNSTTSLFFDSQTDNFGNASSRSHNFGTGFASSGLVTRFDFTPDAVQGVPVPATALVAAAGFGLLGLARRRKV